MCGGVDIDKKDSCLKTHQVKKLRVIVTSETHLDAIGEIQYEVEQLKTKDYLIVLVGCNLFDYEMQ